MVGAGPDARMTSMANEVRLGRSVYALPRKVFTAGSRASGTLRPPRSSNLKFARYLVWFVWFAC